MDSEEALPLLDFALAVADELPASCITSSWPEANLSAVVAMLVAMLMQPVIHELSSGGLCRINSSSCPPSCEGVSPTRSGTTASEASEAKNLPMGLALSTNWLP